MKKKKNKLLILGVFVVIIGFLIGVVPIIFQMIKEKEDTLKVEEFLKNPSCDDKNKEDGYLMVLEIPKIGLKRGVYPKDSPLNTIDLNVAIMEESSLPTKKKGNVILEAHSGTSEISYFDSLYQLDIGDEVYIYYNCMKYTYMVDNNYDVYKDGTVEVHRDIDKNTLTLITCKNYTYDRQSVYILYLKEEERYL